jgi:hypothetical protein
MMKVEGYSMSSFVPVTMALRCWVGVVVRLARTELREELSRTWVSLLPGPEMEMERQEQAAGYLADFK